MLVVADSSPLIVLINIAQIDVLPELFGQVVIPPQIAAELRQSNRPQRVRNFINNRPAWLVETVPTTVESISNLHAGELAAICLAQELKADLLLIDESCARKAATDRGIPIAGTIGLLELAAQRGLLDLQEAFELVKNTDFWISHDLLDERLRLYRGREP